MKLTKEELLKLPLVRREANISIHNFVQYEDGTIGTIYETAPIPMQHDCLGIKTEGAENNTKSGDYVVIHHVPSSMMGRFSVGDVYKVQDVSRTGKDFTIDYKTGIYTLNNWNKLVLLDGVELNKRFVNTYKGLQCDS